MTAIETTAKYLQAALIHSAAPVFEFGMSAPGYGLRFANVHPPKNDKRALIRRWPQTSRGPSMAGRLFGL